VLRRLLLLSAALFLLSCTNQRVFYKDKEVTIYDIGEMNSDLIIENNDSPALICVTEDNLSVKMYMPYKRANNYTTLLSLPVINTDTSNDMSVSSLAIFDKSVIVVNNYIEDYGTWVIDESGDNFTVSKYDKLIRGHHGYIYFNNNYYGIVNNNGGILLESLQNDKISYTLQDSNSRESKIINNYLRSEIYNYYIKSDGVLSCSVYDYSGTGHSPVLKDIIKLANDVMRYSISVDQNGIPVLFYTCSKTMGVFVLTDNNLLNTSAVTGDPTQTMMKSGFVNGIPFMVSLFESYSISTSNTMYNITVFVKDMLTEEWSEKMLFNSNELISSFEIAVAGDDLCILLKTDSLKLIRYRIE